VYTGELTIGFQKISTGITYLQRRNASGGVLAATSVSGTGYAKHRFFDLEYNGGGARETGVCKTRVSDGVSYFQVYVRAGASMNLVTTQLMTGGAMTTLDCFAADMTGNGRDEIIHIFRRNSDSAFGYQVFFNGGPPTLAKIVHGGAFTYQKAFVGNFVTTAGNAGMELAFGTVRNSDSKGVYSVWDETGTQKAVKVAVGNAWVNHQWEAMAAGGSARDNIFIGYVAASDGRGQFQTWNVETNTKINAATVTGPAFTVVEWILGDFDTSTAGDELGVGWIRNSDSAIGFSTKSVSGGALASGVALGSAYVNPQFKGIRARATPTYSVWIGAAQVGGRPILQLYNGATGANQLSMLIMSPGVV
jgi:hypothetical protein